VRSADRAQDRLYGISARTRRGLGAFDQALQRIRLINGISNSETSLLLSTQDLTEDGQMDESDATAFSFIRHSRSDWLFAASRRCGLCGPLRPTELIHSTSCGRLVKPDDRASDGAVMRTS